MKNGKSHVTDVTDVTLRTASLTMRDWDKYSHLGGIKGLSQKIVYLSL